jgi:hypothetical protein
MYNIPMAQIINLTHARQVDAYWTSVSNDDPASYPVRQLLARLSDMPGFKEKIEELISTNLDANNVDILCFLVEQYFRDLLPILLKGSHIIYIQKRIENCRRFINGEELDPYMYAFPQMSIDEKDSRVQFLISVLTYVEMLDKDHQTVAELLDTPISQYEQMVHFIAYFPHEKIPVLLEKLSYVSKESFAKMTISPIGQFKTPLAMESLKNLLAYWHGRSEDVVTLIHKTMQKLVFHNPSLVS